MRVSTLRMSTSLALLIIGFGPLFSAHAAPSPGDTDLIRERQDRLLDEQRRRLEELKDLPGKEAKPTPPAAPADTRCFPIKDIELNGDDSLSEGEKARLLKPFIDQCLGVTQLNDRSNNGVHYLGQFGGLSAEGAGRTVPIDRAHPHRRTSYKLSMLVFSHEV
ncbi:POTRA domain-containing ShlB-type protein [Pseudomonas sp. SJZ080]|nr:POTRA domain-containing ShlB-type protein [Pseudomonas sp. SJZ080]